MKIMGLTEYKKIMPMGCKFKQNKRTKARTTKEIPFSYIAPIAKSMKQF